MEVQRQCGICPSSPLATGFSGTRTEFFGLSPGFHFFKSKNLISDLTSAGFLRSFGIFDLLLYIEPKVEEVQGSVKDN